MPFPGYHLYLFNPSTAIRAVYDFPECSPATFDENIDLESGHGVVHANTFRYRSIYDYRCNLVLTDILEEDEEANDSSAEISDHTTQLCPAPPRADGYRLSVLGLQCFAFLSAIALKCLERSKWPGKKQSIFFN